jgi:hypothetical protein
MRCQDCSREATHTLRFVWKRHYWKITQESTRALPLHWCKWHATVRAVQNNARCHTLSALPTQEPRHV